MDFVVRYLSDPGPTSPRISVSGLRVRVGQVPAPGPPALGPPALGPATVFDLPDDAGAIMQFHVEFPRTQRILEVLAHVFRAAGADVRLREDDFVEIQLHHDAQQAFPSYVTQPMCTVTCPQTGKSNSGPGACIECTDGTHMVRICC